MKSDQHSNDIITPDTIESSLKSMYEYFFEMQMQIEQAKADLEKLTIEKAELSNEIIKHRIALSNLKPESGMNN